MSTLIRSIAEAAAGEASAVAVAAFDDGEVLTACRDGSGNLLLIGWLTPPGEFTITRAPGDSAGLAGEISEVALAVLGRRAVTAVRDGSGNLLMISWDTPPGLGSITRPHLEGTHAGEVSAIAMTTLGADMLITAVRNGSGNLELISWGLEFDATVGRLQDTSSHPPGEVTAVTITALDDSNVITAVRNGSDDLELIGWAVDGNGVLTRWSGDPGLAGGVGFIALDTLTATFNGTTVTTVLTAVTDASGNLLLIAWAADPAGGFTRLTDASAGEATDLAITTTITPAGTPTALVSMRQGSGNLKIIAFDLVGGVDSTGQLHMVLVRSGDYANRADADVTDTTLLTLDPDRILTACRTDNDLDLTTYQVTDAGTVPAPRNILGISFQNPALPSPDNDWAASGGDSYPLSRDHEWIQMLAPDNEYDEDTLVGCSGWVIGPNDSGADVPMTHALGFDWEYHVALDDDNGVLGLLSPAEIREDDDRLQLAEYLGLAAAKGLLGVEWEKNILPPSFRGQVNNGDRVALFGRWIVDTGHDIDGRYRSEIHPPLLMASASVQSPKRRGRPVTRMLLVSRPYLHGQEFAQDVNNVYSDGVDDDGAMFDHLVKELARVIWGQSSRVEAHPKIKERPYRGRHELHLLVEPPPAPAPSGHDLVVSYQFTVRHGCNVRISAQSGDHVDVVVDLGQMRSSAPLPKRSERTYQPDQLDKLSSGAGLDIDVAKLAGYIAGALVGVGALYVYFVLRRGILTDEYAPLPAVDIHDTSHAVTNVPAQSITPGAGIVVDDEQPWPVIGWLEASWMPRRRG
jgi:hypothetical protein